MARELQAEAGPCAVGLVRWKGEKQRRRCLINEEGHNLLVYLGQLLELDEINAAFAEFALREEGMGFAAPLGNLHLGQPRLTTRLHQAGEKPFVGFLVVPITGIHTRMYIEMEFIQKALAVMGGNVRCPQK
jgi:hypothetical protein